VGIGGGWDFWDFRKTPKTAFFRKTAKNAIFRKQQKPPSPGTSKKHHFYETVKPPF